MGIQDKSSISHSQKAQVLFLSFGLNYYCIGAALPSIAKGQNMYISQSWWGALPVMMAS